MATKKRPSKKSKASASTAVASSSVDELLLAALARGDDSFETGRYLVTFKEGAAEEGMQSLGTEGMRVASARDFKEQSGGVCQMYGKWILKRSI
jgi:hypothetical protein